jgi:SAM-dependent methyltransferase
MAAATWSTLIESASAPYRRSSRFAWHFARGKLRRDPVFSHLIERGLIAPHTRVLDIGCGQGLLASLIRAAAAAASQGRWPSAWAAAPVDVRVAGIEVLARDVARARAALGDGAELVCADMRTAAFAAADTVVLLDVLHYLGIAEQDAVLARARAALPDGGRLVLRVGDAASRGRFAASGWVDRLVTLARGQGFGRPAGRTLAAWRQRLHELGFAVASEPMNKGTPFANVLIVGTVIAGDASRTGPTAP